MGKIEVNGPDTHEIYKYLRNNSPLHDAKKGTCKEIPWNFAKFLVDENGKVVEYGDPRKEPNAMRGKIEEMLGLK